MLYIIFFTLLLLAALSAVEIRTLRREHIVLVLLQNNVERASAPGEAVLVDDWWLGILLHASSSPDMRQKLLVTKHAVLPMAVLDHHDELVVVSEEDDPVLTALRERGFTLIPDKLWDSSGLSTKLPFCTQVRIYFAVPQ
jgi:hypothetical protein